MEPEFLDKVREITRQFFELPMEEKHKYCREADGIDGFGNVLVPSQLEPLDPTVRQYLSLFVYPEDQRKLKYWPQNPKAFRLTSLISTIFL